MGCATQGQKAALIKELRKEGYQLKYLLKAMRMARSTYYFEINKVDVVKVRNKGLMAKIQEIFERNKSRYGVRRVHKKLVNCGYNVNHKRVQRLMHNMNLLGKTPKRSYHSYKGKVRKSTDNTIDRDFSTTAPLQKWATDVSQFSFSWGKCYISPILDMNTNEIISYDLSLNPNLEQIKQMLDMAFKKFSSVEGLILHSDQGWQYQHAYFRNILKGLFNRCHGKATVMIIVSWRLSLEDLKMRSFMNMKKITAHLIISKYIDYYNNQRIKVKTK